MDVDRRAGEQARLLGSASDVPSWVFAASCAWTAFQVAASDDRLVLASKVSPMAIFPM